MGGFFSVFFFFKLVFIFGNSAEHACIYLFSAAMPYLTFMVQLHTFTPGSSSIQMQASTVDR